MILNEWNNCVLITKKLSIIEKWERHQFMTTLSMRIEIKTVTTAPSWLVQQDDTHSVIVTDSQEYASRDREGLATS